MKTKAILKKYFQSLCDVAAHGDATELSYYGCLVDFVKAFAVQGGREGIDVTALPAPTEGGNPDFRVWDGDHEITGYIEAKRPEQQRLDLVESTPQLRRYRETFPNLILTNFFEFRLYRNGEMVERALAGQPGTLTEVGAVPPPEDVEGTGTLLERFLFFSMPRTFDAPSLAVELAKRTRFLRDLVLAQLESELESDHGMLHGFYQAFQNYLIGHLEPDQFADLYAQTVTYGLFAARTRAEDTFTRRSAYENIPRTIGVLRDVFRFISLEDPPEQIEWTVDDIAQVLRVADVSQMLERYYEEGKGADPIVHFYEPFLAEYDPEERERRGVYYTPEPVVDYIVRSLHGILKEKFGRPEGLASDGVTLLDPAAGTMTFVARACRQAVDEFVANHGAGKRGEFIQQHLLENFHAFELMMAPYAVGHLKMGFFLEELGHRLGPDERFKFYLTNTLEMEDLDQTELPGMKSLAEESSLAGRVKKQQRILVILGNPPYSGHSSNTGDWITDKIEDYKQVDGKPLGERNPKWLQDDYVKFLRFAQWKIDEAGEGVVGMITNHSWLDNPTFRGMRRSLMKTFDEIYVLDLHGNSLKRETCPDGSPDENVFDIRQGVGIWFFVKTDGDAEVTVRHAERWGRRQKKYDWLEANDHSSTDWEKITPHEEFYLFVPRDEAALDAYEMFASMTQVMPFGRVGMNTHRDGMAIDFDRSTLKRRLNLFRDLTVPDEMVKRALGVSDTSSWKLSESRKKVAEDDEWQEKVVRCLYTPFDWRWLFYHYDVVDRGREDLNRHLIGQQNLALVTTRQTKEPFGSLAVDTVCGQHKIVAKYDGSCVFPLYLYPDASKQNLFGELEEDAERRPNLHPRLIPALTDAYRFEPTPEDVFHYVYAVLYAPSYREKYAEFLKIDFPRVPFTADPELFRALAALGERLVSLHLLESPDLTPPDAKFEGEGDSHVARTKAKGRRYERGEERVYINETQYFEPVPREVWEYQVGGYQVCEKWLKDRRDRTLSLQETKIYCRIVTALARTIDVQEEIDALYLEAERDIVALDL